MEDSTLDLFVHSPVEGSGHFREYSLKRKQSSLESENKNDCLDFPTLENNDNVIVKKPRTDCCELDPVQNGHCIRREHSISSSDEDTLDYKQTNSDGDVASKVVSNDEKSQEELSPTLEESYDLLDSPQSPEWLKDDYFERKLTEHESQRTEREETGQTCTDLKVLGDDVKKVVDQENLRANLIADTEQKNEGEDFIPDKFVGDKESEGKQDDVIILDVSGSSDSVIEIPDDTRMPPTEESSTHSDLVTEKPSLTPAVSIEQDVRTIAAIVPDVNMNSLVQRLVQKRLHPNRVDVVLNEVLEGQLETSIQNDKPKQETSTDGRQQPEDQILADVKEVVRQVPSADPNTVFYMLLESRFQGVDRINSVVTLLKSNADSRKPEEGTHFPPTLKSFVSDPADPIVAGDELYRDMRHIAKIFPDKDQNEIYAYLEAHHDKPNRVQLVMDELLFMASGSQSQEPAIVIDDGVTVLQSTSTNNKDTNVLGDLQSEVDRLCLVFPDCDPNYIFNKLEQNKSSSDRTQRLAAEMFETRNYPKLKDTLEQRSKEALKRNLSNLTLDMEEFLTMFPDPEAVFYDEDKPVTEIYKQHALVQLLNYFPLLKEPFVKKILEQKKYHFTPTLRELETEAAKHMARRKHSPKYLKTPRQIEQPFPDQPDEFFYRELLFTKREEEIKEYIQEQKVLKDSRLAEARANGSLMECGCCFDDECIFEDMAACADGHLFCKECVRRSTEVRIGENKYDFPCLTEGCEHTFQLPTLQSVLPHSVFSNLLRKMQEEEIKKADIPDLVSCPFCSFATIMPNPEDKVFKCLNPECLKESCRLCQEPNHIPLRCEEVEKGGETSMRTFIENRITEAMLRTCWKCNKKFFKLDGCNKMTCVCGATMCYVCRAPAIDYDHFNEQRGCAAFTDMNELHRQEMEKAANEAKTKYQTENPEASGLQLKHDPMKIVEEMRKERERQQANIPMNNMAIPGLPFGAPVFMGGFINDNDNGEEYSDETDSEYDSSYWEEDQGEDSSVEDARYVYGYF